MAASAIKTVAPLRILMPKADHYPILQPKTDWVSAPFNVRVGSQPDVSDSHENVGFRG